ncbi:MULTISPECIES: endodeoxyribonuclease [Burkholderia]|uniref:endodeoxyribonuclease n=1 Tax=Burkholderia TaxID=32008 RepID=UPI000B7A18E6|nr:MULTISPECIES: endodeoxyribonuclease [Burkholderia]MBY4725728.1 hypothetical protein [Burkholderia contaminans]MCI3969266.1 hypothetical protein [Burkholderia sp. HI4860]OXI98500.1 endodeoxyribonuclease [Burkholderia sp. AU33647]
MARAGYGARHVQAAYRSGLEEAIAEQLRQAGVVAAYEEDKIPYVTPATPHKYTPDFRLPNGIYIETKGRFETADRKKHLLIKEQHPELDIRFVFTRSKTTISKASKTTYAMWCDKNGFQYADKWVPDAWLKEKLK